MHRLTGPPRTKRLVNRSEEDALRELNAVTSRYGLRISAKVRVADALPIQRSGIPADVFTYALKSHFDFLATNEDFDPQFAVEFDGPAHNQHHSRMLDAKKDLLCRNFNFPLLRIKVGYLPKAYNGLSLLEWIIDVHYLGQAFNEAQQKGQVPYDDDFDPAFVWAWGERRPYPYWLSADAAIAVKRLHREGKIACPGTSGLIGEDSEGNIRGIEYVAVNDEQGIFVKIVMRAQMFPVRFGRLVEELLLICLFGRIQEYLTSGRGLTPLTTIRRVMDTYESRLDVHSKHSVG